MSARPFIDSLDFAGNGNEISGEVTFAELPRLRKELAEPGGVLHYTVRGGVDRSGSSFLDLVIAGDCRLICQRCLGTLEHEIRVDTRLLLRAQATLDALDAAGGDEEEFDSILAEPQLDLLNLLEEEILLSLPIAPRHESGACQAAEGESANKEEKNPFAVLAKLRVVK